MGFWWGRFSRFIGHYPCWSGVDTLRDMLNAPVSNDPGVHVSTKSSLRALVLLLVLLGCVSVLVGCGSDLAEELQLSKEDAAMLAEIKEILEGIDNGRVVVLDGMPLFEDGIPTDVREFLSKFGYLDSEAHAANVSVYLVDSIETAPDLYEEIKGMPGVQTCEFVDKDQALASMKEGMADQPELFEGLTHNPLPAAFKVTLDSGSRVEGFVAELESRPEVDEVTVADDPVVSLETALFALRMSTRDVGELDRVYALEAFGSDQCLGWNPNIGFGGFGPGPLRCFDSDGEESWSTELDGYQVEFVRGSPDKQAAAVLASKWVTPNDQQYRVLLVTTDPSISPGAKTGEPVVTVLRELPPPDKGFNSPQVAFARDGKSVGLLVTHTRVDSEARFADETTLEVMDTRGDPLWQVTLPENSTSSPERSLTRI